MADNKQAARSSPKAKRQAQILNAAFREFAVNGYAAARLDDVARRAKIAKGTIFLHFRDKKTLFRAVLCDSIQPIRSSMAARPLERVGGSEAALRSLLSHLYSQIVANKKARALLRLLIAESEKFPELARIYYQEIIAPGASTIAMVVEAGITSGEFQAAHARRFPQIVVAPAILAAFWILLLGNSHELDLAGYQEAHLDFVMRALHTVTPTNTPRQTDAGGAGALS